MDLPVKVTHASPAAINGAKLAVSVLDDAFKTLWKNEKALQIQAGTSVTSTATGKFAIPAEYNDRFLLVLAELKDPSGKLISRSVYFPRVLSKMRDEVFFKEYTSAPIPWIALEKGPWLKPAIAKSPQTTLTIVANSREKIGNDRSRIKVTVENTGTAPAFMTKMDISGVKRAIVADDNYFWLAVGESRQIVLDVLWREPDASQKPVLTVKSWNSALATSPLETPKN
jgi:beta-mannosidase